MTTLPIEHVIPTVMGIRDIDSKGGFTHVSNIDIDPPGCRGKVHINHKDCYDKGTEVEASW